MKCGKKSTKEKKTKNKTIARNKASKAITRSTFECGDE